MMRPYEADPAAIYAQSFAAVHREARLGRFSVGMGVLTVRLIHACGMVDIADRLSFSEQAYSAGQAELCAGAPVLYDCEMVGAGIIRRNLPAENKVIVTLNDVCAGIGAGTGHTRSARAVELWCDHMEGAVVVIGNAPSALFHLLNRWIRARRVRR